MSRGGLAVPRHQILGKRGHYLLELQIGGQRFRYADRPLETTTADGRVLRWDPGLRPPDGLSLQRDGASEYEIAVGVLADADWPTLTARRLEPAGGRGRLLRWYEDQVLEQAITIVDGDIVNAPIGERFEPITFTIRESPRLTGRYAPPANAVVDDSTWPASPPYDHDRKITGTPYPIIIGFPGNDGGSPSQPAAPALIARERVPTDDYLLLAAHRVVADQVYLWDFESDPPLSEAAPVIYVQDSLNRTVPVVDMSGMTIKVVLGGTFYSSWSQESGFGGGLPSRTDPSRAMRGGGEVARWALETWTDVRIDRARFAQWQDQLDAYKVDAVISQSTDMWQWTTGQLLDMLPADLRRSSAGVYLHPWAMERDARHAVARLDADIGRVRAVSNLELQEPEGGIVNEVTVLYRLDAEGNYRGRCVVGASSAGVSDDLTAENLNDDARIVDSYLARLSHAKHGRRPRTYRLDLTWDAATAALFATHTLRRQALRVPRISYQGAIEDIDSLSDGDVVILNDTREGLSNVVAEVIDRRMSRFRPVVDLELVRQPPIAQRLAG